jgi:hypothetical protein
MTEHARRSITREALAASPSQFQVAAEHTAKTVLEGYGTKIEHKKH